MKTGMLPFGYLDHHLEIRLRLLELLLAQIGVPVEQDQGLLFELQGLRVVDHRIGIAPQIIVQSEQVTVVPLRRCGDQTIVAPGCNSAGSTSTIQGSCRHTVLSRQVKKLKGLKLVKNALCLLGIRDSLQDFLDNHPEHTNMSGVCQGILWRPPSSSARWSRPPRLKRPPARLPGV